MADKMWLTFDGIFLMARYGYARVSTDEQNLVPQVAALQAAGCDIIREEKASGTSRNGRPELETLLNFLRAGDVLICTRIDRLARSIADLQTIVQDIRQKGAALLCTEQPVDTATAAGKCFLDMLGVFAEFETNLRRERQMEGIQAAKERGVYTGRKPTARGQAEQVRAMAKKGAKPNDIAEELGISRSSVYRCLKA